MVHQRHKLFFLSRCRDELTNTVISCKFSVHYSQNHLLVMFFFLENVCGWFFLCFFWNATRWRQSHAPIRKSQGRIPNWYISTETSCVLSERKSFFLLSSNVIIFKPFIFKDNQEFEMINHVVMLRVYVQLEWLRWANINIFRAHPLRMFFSLFC